MAGDCLIGGYNVHRESDRRAMLQTLGLQSIDELFAQIPPALRLKRELNLPGPMAEWDLESHLRTLAGKNSTTKTHLNFLGEGAYEHYIPATVDAICTRGEFLTAYTPYQPEMSQGLLQILFEYQKLIGALVGLPSVNCSLYDGATALAEAAWMACCIRGIKRVAVSADIWPAYREVLSTYMKGRGVELVSIDDTGEVASLIVQSPNRYGIVEDIRAYADRAKQRGALLHVSTYPIALGVLEAPGKLGADIVTAEGQSLGIPLGAGGPYLGILATHKLHERFLPGRLVGQLTDLRGNRAFALIKEDREQHVSREKSTSHICSNQALHAMRAAVYLATLGERGFIEVARLNSEKAQFFRRALLQIAGVEELRPGPIFNEFALKLPVPAAALLTNLQRRGIFAGTVIDNKSLLIAVTEVKSRAQLEWAAEQFASAVQEERR